MGKARIEIYTDGETTWDYYCNSDWHMYVCPEEEFDDAFVVLPNRNYSGYIKANWWDEAKTILADLDNYEPIPGRVFDFYTEEDCLSHEQRKAILKIYEDCRYYDDAETIAAVAKVLYPEKEFETTTIRGCMQRDWADVVYDKAYENCLDDLEQWWFGLINDIHYEDEEGNDIFWCPITCNKLWEFERMPDFKSALLDYLGIPLDKECEIYEQDGYIQTARWKKVC